MRMIRDDVKGRITRDLAVSMEADSHIETTYNFVEVFPDGKLLPGEEPSDSTWHVFNKSSRHSGMTVPSLYSFYNSCGCNCDWCAQWDNNDDGVQEEYGTKRDFIIDCIENNDNGSSAEERMNDALSHIPIGYFDDEEADE